MGLIYDTTMSPSKLELLAAWLPTRPWFAGDVSALTKVAAYRYDDPEGEVGIEGHLLTAGDRTIYHVPLTYRGAPLQDGEEFLLDTSAHGVLGTRWISDAVGDPVFRTVIAEAIAHGRAGVEEMRVSASGEQSPIAPTSAVAGTGSPDRAVPELWAASVSGLGSESIADTGFATLRVRHVLDAAALAGGAEPAPGGEQLSLRVTWDGQLTPVTVATLSAVAPE
ncbi:maltokinase N-terminal cap-like domain-containing protein [Leucobacter chromiireducens]|uniref:maltokinase N-terminal cap-like domain-containing protein n=1 Tax=Leucobacter chromiireducens TaxID=283877 RepID=UPI000F641233|nr:hypothetical protein [Leucobacter chromiireducens]